MGNNSRKLGFYVFIVIYSIVMYLLLAIAVEIFQIEILKGSYGFISNINGFVVWAILLITFLVFVKTKKALLIIFLIGVIINILIFPLSIISESLYGKIHEKRLKEIEKWETYADFNPLGLNEIYKIKDGEVVRLGRGADFSQYIAYQGKVHLEKDVDINDNNIFILKSDYYEGNVLQEPVFVYIFGDVYILKVKYLDSGYESWYITKDLKVNGELYYCWGVDEYYFSKLPHIFLSDYLNNN